MRTDQGDTPAADATSTAVLDPAESAVPGGTKPAGDPPAPRPPETADQAAPRGDDPETTDDPLVLAQMDPDAPAKPPAAPSQPPTSTTTQPTPGKAPAAADPAKAGDPPPVEPPAAPAAPDSGDAELTEAMADLPQEVWTGLPHTAKSRFLTQRKVLRQAVEQRDALAKAKADAEGRYQAVEEFGRELGLIDPEAEDPYAEYANSLTIAGRVKAGDPAVIPILEQTLAGLRQRAGIPAPAPAAPAGLDPELDAVLKAAEELDIDTSKVRAKYAPAPARSVPPAPPAPAAPPPAPAQPPTAAGPGLGGEAELVAMTQALRGLGVADVKAHIESLMKDDPTLATVPEGKRLGAVLAAHAKRSGSPPPPAPRRPAPPVSGSGRPVVSAGGAAATTTADPLKLATMPRDR